jgi:hypothetical protein
MESGVAYCLIFSPSNAWIRLEVACNLTLWSNRKMCYLPHFLSFLFIEQVLRVEGAGCSGAHGSEQRAAHTHHTTA